MVLRTALTYLFFLILCLTGSNTYANTAKLVNGSVHKKITITGDVEYVETENHERFQNVIHIKDIDARGVNLEGNNKRPGMCTATFVGPNSFITAAHCVEPNKLGVQERTSVYLVNRNNNLQAEFRCSTHPDYANRPFPDITGGKPAQFPIRSSFDVALCYSPTFLGGRSFLDVPQKEVIGLAGRNFLEMSGLKSVLKTNNPIELVGYGCQSEMLEDLGSGTSTNSNGEIKFHTKRYRVKTYISLNEEEDENIYLTYGDVKLSKYAKPKRFGAYELDTNGYIYARSKFDENTQKSEVKTCSGDSGGAGFTKDRRQRIISVTSSSFNYEVYNENSGIVDNALVNLNHRKVKNFIAQFIKYNDNLPKICGFNIPYASGAKSVCKP